MPVSKSSPRRSKATQPSALGCSVLQEHVTGAVRRYLSDLDGHTDGSLHAFVLREVETPMLAEVMRHCDGNLTRAAATLGINRATLRKRLCELGLQA